MGKPFLVASDVHLGAVPASTEASFRRFLDYARENASGLLLNGDLFEFGVAYRSVVPSKHYRVLAKLADLVDTGVHVYFTGGNHDHVEWGGDALTDAGVTILGDRTVLDVEGRRVLVSHGDSVCRGRPAVERLLARSRGFSTLIRSIHPDLLARIQPYTTSTRRQVRQAAAGQGGGPKHHSETIETWAREALRRDPTIDIVVAGHSHLPAMVEVSTGRYYLNAGDWITHYTYVEIPVQHPPAIRKWSHDGPAALSHL